MRDDIKANRKESHDRLSADASLTLRGLQESVGWINRSADVAPQPQRRTCPKIPPCPESPIPSVAELLKIRLPKSLTNPPQKELFLGRMQPA